MRQAYCSVCSVGRAYATEAKAERRVKMAEAFILNVLVGRVECLKDGMLGGKW